MTATHTIQNFIDGEFVDPADGQTEPVLNPATDEAIAQAPLSSAEDVDRAVKAARRAFPGWSTTTPGERARALLKLADAIEEHADELSELESDNAGKPINAFREDEIPFMVDNLRFFAGGARCLEGRAAGEYLSGYTSIIRREPIGVVGQIAPWNYPLMMAVWKIGPALAAWCSATPGRRAPPLDRSIRPVSANGWKDSSSAGRITPSSPPVAPRRTSPGSFSSPPSCPGSGRRTR